MPDPGRLVVIVDDAHLLSHSDVLEGLDSLIRAWQPGLRLILAARSDPVLPLHRYRLAGQMHELRACDLAMTPAEITEVLAIHGVTLPARDFDLFVARTEGWVAGVRLSAMRMAGTGYPADFVSELALDPGSIGEYLTNEVLHRQPEPQRRLLIETSFLDEVTGPLADAVTGMTGCGDMLASLARENSFVIPLDAAQERYRYHQLFAEILRYLLRRQRRQAMRGLHERAVAWYEASGDLVTPSTGPCGQATGTTCVKLHGPGRVRARVRGPGRTCRSRPAGSAAAAQARRGQCPPGRRVRHRQLRDRGGVRRR